MLLVVMLDGSCHCYQHSSGSSSKQDVCTAWLRTTNATNFTRGEKFENIRGLVPIQIFFLDKASHCVLILLANKINIILIFNVL